MMIENKNYTIHFSGYFGYDVAVSAADKREAVSKAMRIFEDADANDFTFEFDGENMYAKEGMTRAQMQLVDSMNEVCHEKLFYHDHTTKEAASEYISKNIDEFKLLTTSNWCLDYD